MEFLKSLRIAIVALLFVVFAVPALAALTEAQQQTLASHIRNNADPAVVAALAQRNDVALADWYNQPVSPAQSGWRVAVSGSALFEAMNLTAYDGLTAGKRASWDLMLRFAPLDMSRNKLRAAVLDIWPAAQANAILTDCTEPVTRAEAVFGGTSATSGTITAIRRAYVGPLLINDVSDSLNRY